MRFHFQLNRRARGYLHRAAGGLTLAVWLFVNGAEICPPLHAWLHGGSIPDDDDCAVVAIALGHVDAGICDVPPVTPVHWIQIEPRREVCALVVVDKHLPPGRAPPFLSVS
ncbi:MAG TPA: hypothetical protein VGN23_12560 [Verrucomicrobiae bacterium]|jgi:hypothetical protein